MSTDPFSADQLGLRPVANAPATNDPDPADDETLSPGQAWRLWYYEKNGELWDGEGSKRLSWESFSAGRRSISAELQTARADVGHAATIAQLHDVAVTTTMSLGAVMEAAGILAERDSLRAKLAAAEEAIDTALNTSRVGRTRSEYISFTHDGLHGALAAIRAPEQPKGSESWGTYTCVHCMLTATGTIHDAGSNRGKQRCGLESGLPYGHNAHPADVPCDNPWTACIGSLTPPTGEQP